MHEFAPVTDKKVTECTPPHCIRPFYRNKSNVCGLAVVCLWVQWCGGVEGGFLTEREQDS